MTKDEACRAVIARDVSCVDCGRQGEVHHIVPRSRFGKGRQADCWAVKNMVLLCPEHHRLKNHGAGAHTHAERVRLLTYLSDRYGYDYGEAPWSEYV
jgi:5-methylcytosine-specific restriction endonuclease McrA